MAGWTDDLTLVIFGGLLGLVIGVSVAWVEIRRARGVWRR